MRRIHDSHARSLFLPLALVVSIACTVNHVYDACTFRVAGRTGSRLSHAKGVAADLFATRRHPRSLGTHKMRADAGDPLPCGN